MCRSALSLKSLHSCHPTAAESQCLCCAARKSTGSIALDSMLAPPYHPIAVHDDASRRGSPCRLVARTSAPQLAAQQRVAALELLDGGAGDRARPGLAIDAGLDFPVRLAGAAGGGR